MEQLSKLRDTYASGIQTREKLGLEALQYSQSMWEARLQTVEDSEQQAHARQMHDVQYQANLQAHRLGLRLENVSERFNATNLQLHREAEQHATHTHLR